MSRCRMRRTLLAVMALLAGPACLAAELPIDRGVGRGVPDFTLSDTAGKPVRLYGYAGKKAVVLVFTATGCPVGDLYLPRLAELATAYEGKGVAFVGIDSSAGEEAARVAEHARQHGADFPILMDPGNVVGDLLLAERTCEVLVVDGVARLRYRGAIDDQYTPKAHKDKPSQAYLAAALDAVLAGREVAVKATPVAGCPIERVEPRIKAPAGPKIRPAAPEIVAAREAGAGPIDVGPVTYAADVAPIVQEKCQECHRPGQVGPFSLRTVDDARRRATAIREVVEDRRMPPWHADPRHGRFQNDRSLTDRQRATILAWVDQGAPPGDPKDLPAPRAFPEGWTIGTPDVVLEMPEPYTVAAQGTLPYQYFRVPTRFAHDTWVQAAEVRPGDRSVVHHIIIYNDDHRRHGGRRADEKGSHLAAYAPGDAPLVLPDGSAKLIPAGSDLIFEVHYTPDGRAKVDRSAVGLVLAKAPVTRLAVTHGIAEARFAIPPGRDDYPVTSHFTFPSDAHLLSLFPHMHLRGKSFRYTATYPDGTSEVLLSVPAYDFAWQSYYRLADPRPMPKGTRIDCLAHFDNSARNPANPDPSKTVRWGAQTFEEMMIGYIDYVVDVPRQP